jgi:phospholipid/cholesterol/gamma-HCH transport system substrate-binding protein
MRTVRIGLLLASALVVLMLAIFSLGQEQRFWERRVQYEIHFARAGGLQTGAPVSLTGVTVGAVDDMRFPPEPDARFIQVLVNVRQDAAPRIREDTVASIRTYGLLGDRYIELSAGSSDSPPLDAGGLIRAIDPVDLETVLGQSGDIVTNVVEVTASLKDVLGTIQRGEGLLGAMVRNRELGEGTLADLRRTMGNVQETTRSLEQILSRVQRGEGLLGQLTAQTRETTELLARVNRTAAALDDFSSRLRDGRGALVRLVEDDAYGDRLLANLDRAVGDLAAVAAKLEHGEGTLAKLVNDGALYDDTRSLVGRARRSWLLRLFGGSDGAVPAATAPARTPAAAP